MCGGERKHGMFERVLPPSSSLAASTLDAEPFHQGLKHLPKVSVQIVSRDTVMRDDSNFGQSIFLVSLRTMDRNWSCAMEADRVLWGLPAGTLDAGHFSEL